MPAAARRIEHRDGFARRRRRSNWNPTALRVCARDWQNVAVVDVTQVGSQEPDHRHKMEYKLVEMLKGTTSRRYDPAASIRIMTSDFRAPTASNRFLAEPGPYTPRSLSHRSFH